MSVHTPGPWIIEDDKGDLSIYVPSDNGLRYVIAREGGGEVFQDANGKFTDYSRVEANARLIAAAPELMEACETFVEWLRREEAPTAEQPWFMKRDTREGETAWREWFNENIRICELAQKQAKAAIVKATGATP